MAQSFPPRRGFGVEERLLRQRSDPGTVPRLPVGVVPASIVDGNAATRLAEIQSSSISCKTYRLSHKALVLGVHLNLN